MTLYYLTPISAIFQYFNNVGTILSGGKIHTYLAGTSTPQATYTDITGGTANANPMVLTSDGRLNNAQIWQPGGVNLKIIIADANDNQLGPVFDQVSGINDPATTLASLADPSDGFGVYLVANAVRSFDLFSSMRAHSVPFVSGAQTIIVQVEGGSGINDGLGGSFIWSTTSTAADDNFSVIKPAAAGASGRYLRLVEPIATNGFFQGTLAGVSGTVTQSCFFTVYNAQASQKFQQLVTIYGIGAMTGTSNTNTLALTGLPTSIRPNGDRRVIVSPVINNNTSSIAEAIIYDQGGGGAGTIGFGLLTTYTSGSTIISGGSLNLFTGSGVKGLGAGLQITYNL